MLTGLSLKTILRKESKLNDLKCQKVLKPILEALEYMHSLNISHRDIKLENIMIDSEGNPKLIDFGFSIKSSKKLKFFCGTLPYMPPEIMNKKEYLGPLVDIWAFGILIYTLLTGKFPFQGLSEKDLMHKIQIGTFIIPKEVSSKARIAIKKLLNVDMNNRITSKEV